MSTEIQSRRVGIETLSRQLKRRELRYYHLKDQLFFEQGAAVSALRELVDFSAFGQPVREHGIDVRYPGKHVICPVFNVELSPQGHVIHRLFAKAHATKQEIKETRERGQTDLLSLLRIERQCQYLSSDRPPEGIIAELESLYRGIEEELLLIDEQLEEKRGLVEEKSLHVKARLKEVLKTAELPVSGIVIKRPLYVDFDRGELRYLKDPRTHIKLTSLLREDVATRSVKRLYDQAILLESLKGECSPLTQQRNLLAAQLLNLREDIVFLQERIEPPEPRPESPAPLSDIEELSDGSEVEETEPEELELEESSDEESDEEAAGIVRGAIHWLGKLFWRG
jgi:hypothetical protein